MKRNLRNQIIGGLICIGIISALFATIFYLRQANIRDFTSNTYAKDSTIEQLLYGVKFTDGEILIENSFDISKGKINGYSVSNSTILENVLITNELTLGSIDLYNDVNLTLKNIHRFGLQINVHDRANLRLYDCTIGVIYINDFSSTSVSNSTIGMIYGKYAETFLNQEATYTSLLIENSSSIYFHQSHPGTFIIKNSIIDSISLFQSNISGKVENSSISYIRAEGKITLDIFGATISDIKVLGQSQVTVNATTVLSDLWYGVNIYSGSVNITAGIIQGSTYCNNTNIIDSFINKTHLVEIMVSNSSVVHILNYSVNFLLYDFAMVTLHNTKNVMTPSIGLLYNSSELIVENSNLYELQCYDKSSLTIQKNSTVKKLWLETSNRVIINNLSIETLGIYSEYGNDRNTPIITNSLIDELYIWPFSLVYLENCTIQSLYEGIFIYSGVLTMNSTGINGSGDYTDYIITKNNTITSRSLKFIEIINSAQLYIKNLQIGLSIILRNNAKVNLENCVIENIKAEDSSTASLNLCSFTRYNSLINFNIRYFKGNLDFYDDSQLYVDQTSRSSVIDLIFLYGSSRATIEEAEVMFIYIHESSAATITDSEVSLILIWASNSEQYSLSLFSSNVDILSTISWSY